MDLKVILLGATLVVVAVTFGWAQVNALRNEDPMQDKDLLNKGKELPCAWVFVGDNDVNSRRWTDFMSRSSRVMNVPFLNLCYETMTRNLSKSYRIEVIGGLHDLAGRLGGWDKLPETMQSPQTVLRAPEMNWIRAAVLARWGGLWISPATVWLRDLGCLPADKVVFFGTDAQETHGSQYSNPSLEVIWSPRPEHPIFVEWELKVRNRLNRKSGGSEFRRDEMSDARDAIVANKDQVEVRTQEELSRKGRAVRRIELEDLLAAGTKGDLPFTVGKQSVYVPVPWPELLERETFGWFLRMSEDQILESDLVLSHLVRKGLSD